MFGAEPEEKMTQEDLDDFEKHVEERHKKVLKDASIAGSIFLFNIFLLLPFLAGHSLHLYWERVGKFILILAMGTFLWCVLKIAAIWASYQAARDTRREFRDID